MTEALPSHNRRPCFSHPRKLYADWLVLPPPFFEAILITEMGMQALVARPHHPRLSATVVATVCTLHAC
jgi:hypothetical protein